MNAYQGRPIAVHFESMPGMYIAIFDQEYDGAPDSRNPVGMGKTEEAAVADLIEQEEQ